MSKSIRKVSHRKKSVVSKKKIKKESKVNKKRVKSKKSKKKVKGKYSKKKKKKVNLKGGGYDDTINSILIDTPNVLPEEIRYVLIKVSTSADELFFKQYIKVYEAKIIEKKSSSGMYAIIRDPGHQEKVVTIRASQTHHQDTTRPRGSTVDKQKLEEMKKIADTKEAEQNPKDTYSIAYLSDPFHSDNKTAQDYYDWYYEKRKNPNILEWEVFEEFKYYLINLLTSLLNSYIQYPTNKKYAIPEFIQILKQLNKFAKEKTYNCFQELYYFYTQWWNERIAVPITYQRCNDNILIFNNFFRDQIFILPLGFKPSIKHFLKLLCIPIYPLLARQKTVHPDHFPITHPCGQIYHDLGVHYDARKPDIYKFKKPEEQMLSKKIQKYIDILLRTTDNDKLIKMTFLVFHEGILDSNNNEHAEFSIKEGTPPKYTSVENLDLLNRIKRYNKYYSEYKSRLPHNFNVQVIEEFYTSTLKEGIRINTQDENIPIDEFVGIFTTMNLIVAQAEAEAEAKPKPKPKPEPEPEPEAEPEPEPKPEPEPEPEP
jgi:hypothetical protein